MKNFQTAIIFGIIVCFGRVQTKNFKSYYGNSIEHYKGQRKPFASPLGNVIHDNYKRPKRQMPQAIIDFQEAINRAKYECVHEMNMDARVLEKSLLYEELPTKQDKCLMMCMLKKTKLMENNNKLSTKTIARIAGALSEDNPLVVSVAVATANNCNNFMRALEPCEAAYHINNCIGHELRAHKLKLYY